MAERIIPLDRSVIPAADITNLGELDELIKKTHDVEGIGGYKVGMSLVDRFGLVTVASTIRRHGDHIPMIWDRQKGGTDIPDLAGDFAAIAGEAGVTAAILFPMAGPVTLENWVKALQDRGIGVIVGGHMTHKAFLVSEGGFIANEAPAAIYEQAANWGVRDFVVPGNKVESVRQYRMQLEGLLGTEEFRFYAPGLLNKEE